MGYAPMVGGRVDRWEPFLTGYGMVMVLKEKVGD